MYGHLAWDTRKMKGYHTNGEIKIKKKEHKRVYSCRVTAAMCVSHPSSDRYSRVKNREKQERYGKGKTVGQ